MSYFEPAPLTKAGRAVIVGVRRSLLLELRESKLGWCFLDNGVEKGGALRTGERAEHLRHLDADKNRASSAK